MSALDNVRRAELKRLLRHRGMREIEVYNAVETILAERRRWTALALGQRVNLIFAEKTRLGIRSIACVDRSKKMMALYYLEQRRDRDRRRKTKMRAKETPAFSPRAKQLACALDGEWTESRVLGERVQKHWKLKPVAMRQAMRRTSQELCEAGIAELKYGAGSQGSRVLFLRIKPMIVDLSAYRSARNADEIRVPR
jgi:hypothetical protein